MCADDFLVCSFYLLLIFDSYWFVIIRRVKSYCCFAVASSLHVARIANVKSDTTSSSVRTEKNWIVRLTRSHPPECKMGPFSIHRIGKSFLSEIQTQAHPLCVFRSVRQVGVDRIQAEVTQRSRINAESNRCQGASVMLMAKFRLALGQGDGGIRCAESFFVFATCSLQLFWQLQETKQHRR